MPKDYKIAESPVRKGVTFLEASAGTGKTYTISRIAVRLIAEEGLPVSKILVVTFTETATKELNGRIRQAIAETLHQLNNPNTKDPLARTYGKKETEELKLIQNRLKLALAYFDEASIFTIHGFCNRVLNDFAFESNQLFEPKLIKEPTPLWTETLQDLWRKNFYQNDSFLAALLTAGRITPYGLIEAYRSFSQFPNIEVLPIVSKKKLQDSIQVLRKIWDRLAQFIAKERETLLDLLEQESSFESKFRKEMPALRASLKSEWPTVPTTTAVRIISRLSLSHLTKKRLKGAKDLKFHAAFHHLGDEWQAAFHEFCHQQRFICLRQARKLLQEKKKQDNLLTFEDLVPRVLNILESGNGNFLQSKIQNSYQAALIDEFQDTDPEQTELFRRLFISPDHFLFLIGDPKQAIYKFRGADIFSYLNARNLADRIYTLPTNWRSDPALIDAVNGLFSQFPAAFVFPEIPFLPSESAVNEGQFTLKGKRLSHPFQFCFQKSETDKPITNELGKQSIRLAMASEILRLLGGDYQINGNNVQPADIAILTRTKQEGIDVRDELSLHGLPSVFTTDQTVFESREAHMLSHLLRSLLEPYKAEWTRALYTSEWFGWDASTIFGKNETVDGWEEIQNKIRKLCDRWNLEGIAQTMADWISWSGVKQTLLAQPGGERAVTNLLHLVELITQAEEESELSPLSLTQWLDRTIKDPDRERDDFLSRLESDENAIQIMTIHKSKGLQYPIVFVPFAWSKAVSPLDDVIYHQSANNYQLVLDRREEIEETDQQQFRKESLSDALRLLYVALTRAKHATYLFWGDFKSLENSSIGYLLGIRKEANPNFPQTTTEALELIRKKQLPGIAFNMVTAMTEDQQPEFNRFEKVENLTTKNFHHKPDSGFSISSFSSLATGFKESLEESFEEEEESKPDLPGEQAMDSIFTLPKGAVTGTLIHNILEKSDFSDPESVKASLKSNIHVSALESKWGPILEEHLITMLDTPLQGTSGLKLNKLDNRSCLAETEFHFPTRNTCLKSILNYFKSVAGARFGTELPTMEHCKQQRLRGFLRGFIDLLFKWENRYYILDWKSNWLGDSLEEYGQDHLNEAMTHSAYFLQYYLYSLATVRYLHFRDPDFNYDKHFGGVYYIFIRGVHPTRPGSGVFFDRPEKSAIQTLDNLFAQN
ncbi:MAG: exodeoxyribonuclease V subunit beta [Opitutaceae bacterium]|nr:exodeoxyribonuclease V subunit beta [Opitutaceae bacterium]